MSQVLIALDQLLNAVLNGWADETLSARAYRNAAKGHEKWIRVRRAIDALFFWEANHCYWSYRNEISRQHLPPAYRETP